MLRSRDRVTWSRDVVIAGHSRHSLIVANLLTIEHK